MVRKASNIFLEWTPWGLSIATVVLAITAWGQGFMWNWSALDINLLFPVFGLIAFSLMWVHYTVDFLERIYTFKPRGNYLPITRILVFFSIMLHPGLLALEQWQKGFGLPPLSLLNYAGPDLQIWIVVGMVAWLTFMIYELHRWYRNRPWFKYIEYATDASMLVIFFHALNLGSNLQMGWLKILWYFYGITLACFIFNTYIGNRNRKMREIL